MTIRKGLITSASMGEVQPHCRRILRECAARIREFGKSRMEYPILAIVAMEICLS